MHRQASLEPIHISRAYIVEIGVRSFSRLDNLPTRASEKDMSDEASHGKSQAFSKQENALAEIEIQSFFEGYDLFFLRFFTLAYAAHLLPSKQDSSQRQSRNGRLLLERN